MVHLKESPLDRFYSQVTSPGSSHGMSLLPSPLHTAGLGPPIISLLSSLSLNPNSLTAQIPDTRGVSIPQ